MKKLNVILFKDELEIKKYSDIVCKRFSQFNLSPSQEFCGIWGKIKFNHEECRHTISSTINYFLNSDKTEIYFGCCENDYNDIITHIKTDKYEIKLMSCTDL